jgi:hypothetical protein
LAAGRGHQHLGNALQSGDQRQFRAGIEKALDAYQPHISNAPTLESFYASLWAATAHANLGDAKRAHDLMVHAYSVGAQLVIADEQRFKSKQRQTYSAEQRMGVAEVLDAMEPYIPRANRVASGG